MRAWFPVVLACLIGTTLAGCIDDEFSEAVPVWEPGYSWTYQDRAVAHVTTSGSGQGDGTSTEAQIRLLTRLEVLNADATVAGAPAYLVALSQEIQDIMVDGKNVMPDGAEASGFTTEAVGALCGAGCTTVAYVRKADLAVAMSPDGPAQARFAFPLENGKTWKIEPADDTGQQPVVIVASVKGRGPVALDETKVDAIRVESHADPDSVERLEDTLRKQSPPDVKVSLKMKARGTDHYAPRFAGVAASDALLDMAMRFSQGKSTFTVTTKLTYESRLADHVLDPKPPRTLDEFLEGPLAPLPPAEPWPFVIEGSVGPIAAAPDEIVSLWIGNESRLEEGAVIRWTYQHRGLDGVTMDRHKGEAFNVPVSEPGAHRVIATVHDAEGRLRGVASTMVDAYSRIDLHQDGPVGLTGVTGPAESTIRIAPDACGAVLHVDPQAAARGTYRIENGSTSETGTVLAAQPTTVDLAPLAVPGVYDVSWNDDLRVGAVDVGLEVHYGCEPTEAEAFMQAATSLWELRRIGTFGPYGV